MTIEPDTPEAEAPRPQIPRLGPASSGLVALLLVGALFVIPLLGLLIAPLGALPVLSFQSSGLRCSPVQFGGTIPKVM